MTAKYPFEFLLTRRKFLEIVGTVATAGSPFFSATSTILDKIKLVSTQPGRMPTFRDRSSISIVRPEDLLVITFEFIGFNSPTENNGKYELRRKDKKAYIVVELPPQHIAENSACFTNGSKGCPGVEQSWLSGPSRLALEVPDGISSIPYSLQELLMACKTFPLSLAMGKTKPIIVGYTINDINDIDGRPCTAIEVPYGLALSPDYSSFFDHATETTKYNGRTELWHTCLRKKLGSPSNNENLPPCLHTKTSLPIFALTTHHYDPKARPSSPGNSHPPFPMSMNDQDRWDLVYMRSFGGVIQAERLMLTSLGAWMNVSYVGQPYEKAALEEWIFRGTMGREHYVKIATSGILLPFGHVASCIEVTERQFGNNGYAYLKKNNILIVRESEKEYNGYTVAEFIKGKRQMPFRRIRIDTKEVSGLIDDKNFNSSYI